MEEVVEGQLRGIGLRLDPEGILIAPHESNGAQWGYTIIDKSQIPSMYIGGEWKPVVPEGVWLQMKANWDQIGKQDRSVIEKHPIYLDYPELKALFDVA